MNPRAIAWALSMPVRGTQKLALLVLACNADSAGSCKRSQRDIAEQCGGLSRETVNRAIAQLVKQGLVAKTLNFRPDGSQGPNGYRLRIPANDFSSHPCDTPDQGAGENSTPGVRPTAHQRKIINFPTSPSPISRFDSTRIESLEGNREEIGALVDHFLELRENFFPDELRPAARKLKLEEAARKALSILSLDGAKEVMEQRMRDNQERGKEAPMSIARYLQDFETVSSRRKRRARIHEERQVGIQAQKPVIEVSNQAAEAWLTCREQIRADASDPLHSWIRQVKLVAANDDHLVFAVPNDFFAKQVSPQALKERCRGFFSETAIANLSVKISAPAVRVGI